MASRYSRMLKAARYHGAITAYINWIQGKAEQRGDRIGTGEPRVPSATVYIDPFAIALPTATARVPQGLSSTTLANAQMGGLAAYVPHRATVAPADEDLIVAWEGYRAPRVIIKTGFSGRAVKKVSKVTGLPYGSYGGRSTSLPFGKNLAADTEASVFAALRTAFLASVPNSRVSLTREKYASPRV